MEVPLNLERIDLVSFFELQKPSHQDRGRDSTPTRTPTPPCSPYTLLRDQADLGGILLWEKREGDVRGAMFGSLGLILSCEMEILRGRSILEVKSSFPFY